MSTPTPSTTLLYHDDGRQQFQILGGAIFRSFRCLWMLEELGIPYEHVLVRPQSRKIKAYNPLGKVPALVVISTATATTTTQNKPTTTDFIMYESAAINTYLGDLVNHQQPNHLRVPVTITNNRQQSHRLVPLVGTNERGRYDQTLSCIMTEMDAQGLWIHRKHGSDMAKFFGYIPEAVQHAKQHFEAVNAVLAQQIVMNDSNNNQYLVGSHFTAADILYVHCLDWSQSIGWDEQWKKDVKLCEYVRRCQTRPAYRKIAAIRAKEQQAMMEVERKRKSKKLLKSKL